MDKIIIGTTPTFKFVFNSVDPQDIVIAYMTIMKNGQIIIEKTLQEAVVEENSVSWSLSQEETLRIGACNASVMLNYVLNNGIRGASGVSKIVGVTNHINEVISNE